MSITAADIRALRDEAGQAGDLEQVEICTQALDGSEDAWAECERVIADAAAQAPIALTGRDVVILRRMTGRARQDAAPLSWAGWQPHENDASAVGDMIRRGILRKTPGFDSIELTQGGSDAWEDYLDAEAAPRAGMER